MKSLALAGFIAVAAGPLASAAVVYESDAEFFASGDFDADGRLDVLVVDRDTGTFRIGYQRTVEFLTWSNPRVSGITELTGAAVGRFFASDRDALAVTEPGSNRVALVAANDPAVESAPVELFPEAVGPAVLAALDLPGVGPGNDPALDDLFIGARLGAAGGDPSRPDVISESRANGDAILLQAFAVAAPLSRPNAVLLKTGLPRMAAVLVGARAAPGELQVYHPSSDPPALGFSVSAVQPGSAFVVEHFALANPLAQVLLFVPGAPQLRLRPVTEPAAGTFAPGPETVFDLGAPISQIVVVPDPGGPRLMVLFNDGTSVTIFSFDGVNPPVSRLATAAPAGRRFTGAGTLGGGHFILGSGAASLRRSDMFHRYHRNADGTYQAAQTGALPFVGTHTGKANVLFFAREPFVSADPQLLGIRRTPDWATNYNLQGTTVQRESYAGGGTGLASPQTVNLAPFPAGAQFILPNQFRADSSVLNFRGSSLLEVDDVSVTPPPGFYQEAVTVTLIPRASNRQVFYRLGVSQPWSFYAGALPVALDTTIEYYSVDAFGQNRSRVFSAPYRFPDGGMAADSDADSVPDFVELARGLNVKSGRDTDGDGVSDLQELLAGTDPGNASSKPSNPPSLPGNTGFGLTVSPVFYQGFAQQSGWLTAPDVEISLRDTSGVVLASGPTQFYVVLPPLGTTTQARFQGVRTPDGPFFAVSTPANFPLSTPARTAAELVTLFTAPERAVGGIDYLPQGRTLAVESAAWVAAMQTYATATATAPQAEAELSPLEVMVALLVEAKVRLILSERGIPDATAADLFPFRSATAATHAIAPETLGALETLDAAGHPAYDLGAALEALRATTRTSSAPGVQNLRLFAMDAYQTFEAALPDNSPGATALSSPPIETIRTLLAGGTLPADYLAVSALTASQRTNAAAAAQTMLAAVTPRPVASRTLEVLIQSFGPLATVLRDGTTSQTVALIDAQGLPWRFAGALAPPTGSRLSVTAFTDVTVPPALAPTALEVIRVAILSFPPPPPDDLDGDGLSDAWEHALLGGLTAQPFGDPDADGFTNAQEFSGATDPNDECSMPAILPAPFVPILRKTHQPDGNILLFWDYPAHLLAGVQFSLESSTDLQTWLTLQIAITQPTPGHFEALHPPGPTTRTFYQLRVIAQ